MLLTDEQIRQELAKYNCIPPDNYSELLSVYLLAVIEREKLSERLQAALSLQGEAVPVATVHRGDDEDLGPYINFIINKYGFDNLPRGETNLFTAPPLTTAQQSELIWKALEQALERMDRARNILTNGNPTPECNWGMLDTSDIRALLPEEGKG